LEMKELSFDKLCELLATSRGGYTLWIGAGAAKALCPKAPTWRELSEGIRGKAGAPPEEWKGWEFPRQLEWLASKLGHQVFRAELRKALVEPMVTQPLDEDVIRAQAMIGLRAGPIVSFNVEMVSSFAFASAHGGCFIARPYQSRWQHSVGTNSVPGLAGLPVFFPHGLLDVYGECVITQSEYDRHEMSLAFRTAVGLCLGGDLLILGMSLSDPYLRRGILENRRWIRDVFWVASDFGC